MKNTARLTALLICILTICCSSAQADRDYLIADSNTRRLTWSELEKWDYESLGYIFNEIFARHGYVFNEGGQYDMWFSSHSWYHPNASDDNGKYVMPYVTQLEWDNYHLIKNVRAYYLSIGEPRHNPNKLCYANFPPSGNWTLTGFSPVSRKPSNLRLPVYSAPGKSSWRGANGKALVNTSGGVWAAGWENGFLLVFYETNSGGIRVGYVSRQDGAGQLGCDQSLRFSYVKASLQTSCQLTDDPLLLSSVITRLSAGAQVTYLSTMFTGRGDAWDYVETTAAGQTVRGFISSGLLDLSVDTEDAGFGFSG